MSEEFDIFEKIKKECNDNYSNLKEECKKLVEEIDNLVVTKYGDRIKQCKDNIKMCRRILGMKGKFSNKYFDLVDKDKDKDKNNKCEDNIEK